MAFMVQTSLEPSLALYGGIAERANKCRALIAGLGWTAPALVVGKILVTKILVTQYVFVAPGSNLSNWVKSTHTRSPA